MVWVSMTAPIEASSGDRFAGSAVTSTFDSDAPTLNTKSRRTFSAVPSWTCSSMESKSFRDTVIVYSPMGKSWKLQWPEASVSASRE